MKQLKTMKVNEPKLEDIPVVREFPGVLPEDLSSLPPSREMEFRIDLIPGAIPVAKSPRFIANFSKIAKPLTLLTQKNKKFKWGDEQETAFQTLKDILCDAPILALPEGVDDFVVYCDALNQGFCCVLMQRNKVIAYASRQLKIHEKTYTTHDLDLGAVVFALKTWRHDFDYDCEIRYHPGKANIVADALSRKEQLKPRRAWAISMKIHSSIKARILEAQSEASKDNTRKPSGLIQQPEIPEWKWENITMDFIAKLSITRSEHDSIWVVVDRLTKSAHFLTVREDLKIERLARLYINEIVARHDVPFSIISDRDSYFTSRFWQSLQKALGTRLDLSTAYHPETDGQSERTIQTLEDMLRACAMDFGENWDTHLPLVEYSYNNNYHSSVKCAPFKALYGRKCRTPIAWVEVGESKLIGPKIIQETTDKIVKIKERLKIARDCQKRYSDNRRKPLEFSVGDKVLLKVSPRKGVVRFGKRSKISPRYVGPFEIVERVGPVAYRLCLPQELAGFHDTFHVSNLKKCLAEKNLHVLLEEVKIDDKLHFVEEPMEIMDREVKKLKKRRIPIIIVRWNSRRRPELIWERENEMKHKYLQLFASAMT
nr:putative reverse transcriptase domain-containing protein [Tanacetum cinerariifolium]